MAKSNKLPDHEIDYIRKHSHEQTPVEIASHLGRDPRTIKKYIQKYNFPEYGLDQSQNDRKAILRELEGEEFFHRKVLQLFPDEIEYFKSQWVDNIQQFEEIGGAPIHQEKMQLVDLIITQILLDRLLIQEKELIENKMRLKDRLEKERKKSLISQDVSEIRHLEEQIDMLDATRGGLAKPMKEYSTNIQTIQKQLKITRDQRLQNIVESKKDFVALMKMLEDEEYSHREGKKLILFRLAMEREREKLIEYHTFMDNSQEVPFLIPELVEKYKIENNIQ